MSLTLSDKKILSIIILIFIVVAVTFGYISSTRSSSTVSSSTPDIIIHNGTWINISAQNGWSIGMGYIINVSSNSVLTGNWNSTQPTNLSLWTHYQNKSYFPKITNDTKFFNMEEVSINLSPGIYSIEFQTISWNDHIHIDKNFTLLQVLK